MRNYRIVVLVVAIVAGALVAGYYLGHRPPTITPPASITPPPVVAKPVPAQTARAKQVIQSVQRIGEAPKRTTAVPRLTEVFTDLKARADAGDADAASDLYRDLGRCNRVKELSQELPHMIPSILDADANETPEQAKQREFMLDSMQKQLDFVKRHADFCANLDDTTLQQFVPSSLKAAQLGDMHAARCYLGASVNFTTGLLDHPEWLTDFKQNAMSLADQGIQRGDWGIAGLLGHAYGGIFSSSFLTQLTGSDPTKAYQYLKLQRIGANDAFVDKLDKQLAEAADGLTSDQLAQADAWAQSTYDAHFSGTSSNELSNGVNLCGMFDDN